MTDPTRLTYDVLGLGNAIVDVIAETDDRALDRLGLAKGTMTLIERARMTTLYDGMGPAIEMSGGSCANTMAALASLGAKAAYVGKVQDDQLDHVFREQTKDQADRDGEQQPSQHQHDDGTRSRQHGIQPAHAGQVEAEQERGHGADECDEGGERQQHATHQQSLHSRIGQLPQAEKQGPDHGHSG